MSYRPDIDGLRAIAVLAVIFTHAGIMGFGGGFIGVDVFFVISGYLIYRDLVTRLNEGRLSLAGFYGRRMRRTLPALYFVCAVTLAGALIFMMPTVLAELARSTVAAVLLVPNIFYTIRIGYFTGAIAGLPLLHTWSLGVEEQFYLLAPLLPLALRGLAPARRKLSLVALSGACVALTIGVRLLGSRDAAFFLMPSRAFEFLVGCLLAEEIVPAIRARWAAEAVTSAALVAIAVSIASFSEATPLPGVLSLVPCLATAAIIHVGGTRKTLVGTMLGLRGIAFIGLISYSLYLWHWPLIVVARDADWPMTPAHMLGGGALLFGLSVLSWRFIETPFRNPHSHWRAWTPMLVPGAAAGLACICIALVAAGGLPGRFPSDVASVESYATYRDQRPYREGQCFITSRSRLAHFDRAACLQIVPEQRNVLLIGDSHAAHLWTGLADAWPEVNFLQATASGCKPIDGTTGTMSCTSLMHEMLDDFVPAHHLDAVAIAGFWNAADVAPLLATIARLQPHVRKIVVFGPVPLYDRPLATLLAKSMLRGSLDVVPGHLAWGTKDLDADMQAKIAPVATYVSPWQAVCPHEQCRLFADAGVPMQFDYSHLTKPGAAWMMAAIRKAHPALFEPLPPVDPSTDGPRLVSEKNDDPT